MVPLIEEIAVTLSPASRIIDLPPDTEIDVRLLPRVPLCPAYEPDRPELLTELVTRLTSDNCPRLCFRGPTGVVS